MTPPLPPAQGSHASKVRPRNTFGNLAFSRPCRLFATVGGMWFGGYRTYSRAGWAPDPAFVNSARLAKADRKNRLPPEWPRAAIVSQFPAAFGRSRRPHGVAGHAGGPRDVPAGREPCWRRSSGSIRSGRSPRWCLSWSQRCSRSRFSTSAEISPARKPSVCSAAPFGPRAASRTAGRPQTRHRSAPRPSPGGFALLQNLSFTGGTGPRIGGCR